MNSILIRPKNEILKKYIQYFLFFQKTNTKIITYTTFPNNNLCLAIYKQNKISHFKINENKCIIENNKFNSSITSKLLGFHKTPFHVEISTELDQICILFHPAALKIFTKESFENLLDSDNVFNEIFGNEKSDLEEIFELTDITERAKKLEIILLKNLKNSISVKMEEALLLIHQKNMLSVEILSKELQISEVTLFRLFKMHLGQNPKSYVKTIRFRNALNDILYANQSLTNIAYQNQYFDQSHFIKDFKNFTGIPPKNLSNKISIRQQQLLWIYNNK
ncbi:helix-turn-helix domain-containing protein [Flavobacterium sp. U410]